MTQKLYFLKQRIKALKSNNSQEQYGLLNSSVYYFNLSTDTKLNFHVRVLLVKRIAKFMAAELLMGKGFYRAGNL